MSKTRSKKNTWIADMPKYPRSYSDCDILRLFHVGTSYDSFMSSCGPFITSYNPLDDILRPFYHTPRPFHPPFLTLSADMSTWPV